MSTTVVTAKFTADTSDLSGKLSGVQGQLNKTATSMRQTGESTAAMGRQMTMAAAPIIAFGAVATKAFIDFDDKMTQSLAIMTGVTSAMREEMEATARTVATTFGIAADKAAESYFFLASAGLDAEQSIAALPQVAAFATAGMFDMATATDLATDAQSALGLTVDDAAANLDNLTRVTDVLVKANTLANATVEQFSTSLTNKAGAALKGVNKDIEEGVAVLAALADQGIKAQLAGNQLAIVMRDLQTKAIDNKEEMDQFGVTVFDADGKMRNLGDIVADLEGGLAGLSDEQRRAAFTTMGFSDRSLAALTALLGTSDAIKQYEQDLRDAGNTTQDVAGRQMESMAKQIEIMKARFMDLALGVGSVVVSQFLTPLMSALDALVTAFSAIPDPIRNMAVTLGLVVALTGPILWMFGSVMKGLAGMTVAFAAANARVTAFAVRAVTSFKSVGAGAGMMTAHVAAALMSKRIAMEVASLAVKKFAAATVMAMRTVVGAFRGLLVGLGPIGIALIAAGAAFEIFTGKSAAAEELVTRLKDSVDELTGAFGQATAAAISAQFRMDISDEDINALRDMGISIEDMTRAAMEGGPAAEAFNQKLQELINSKNLFDPAQDLLITTQRNFGGMVNASDEAKKRLEADAKARADAAAIEGEKARVELSKTIAAQQGAAIERAQQLKSITAAEFHAMEARKRAADAAIAKDNALAAVTNAAKDAVTALEGAMSRLSEVIGNQNSRNAAIRSTRDLSKALDDNGKKITGTSEAAMKNQDAIAASASSWINYAKATDDPIKQQNRLKKGEEEIRAALEKKGIDPEQSPIVRQFKTQLEKSQETVDEFKKRADEARDHGISTGRNFIQGIIEELRRGASQVRDASIPVGAAMPAGVDEGTDSDSPSKKGMQNAKNFIDGVIAGLKADKVYEKASDLGKAVVDAFEREMQRFIGIIEQVQNVLGNFAGMTRQAFGELSQIQTAFTGGPSSVIGIFDQMTAGLDEMQHALSDVSIFGRKAVRNLRNNLNEARGYLKNAAQHAINLMRDISDAQEVLRRREEEHAANIAGINSHYDGLERAAKAQLDGVRAHYDGLVKAGRANIKRLQKHFKGLEESARDAIKRIEDRYKQLIPSLEAALKQTSAAYDRENSVLQGLIQDRDKFLGQIGSGFRSFVNNLRFETAKASKQLMRETKTLANGIVVTLEREIEVGGSPQGIAQALESRLAAVRDFGSNIRTLMQRGLDPSLVADFVSAGIDGSGEVVAALAQASAEDLAAINEVQAGLAAEVADFQQYAAEQWHEAGIATQQAILAPIEAARDAAQMALDMANAAREQELAAAQAHLEGVLALRDMELEAANAHMEALEEARERDINNAQAALDQIARDRAAAINDANTEFDTERARREQDIRDMEKTLKDHADEVQSYFDDMGRFLPPKMLAIGWKTMGQFREGFMQRFPKVKGNLNNRMDELVNSMKRPPVIIEIITVHKSVFEGTARAMGGPVVANRAYVVGERGPEMFVPNISGSIIPNHDLGSTPSMDKTRFRAGGMAMGGGGGGGGNMLTINVNVPVSANKSEIGREIVEAINQFERVSGTSWRG
jgi:TP901 family phage tail tape measure protein